MRHDCEKAGAFSLFSLSAIVTFGSITGAAVLSRGSDLPISSPQLISVKAATSDGISKINLLSDDSHLYITEQPAEQVIATVSLAGLNRSVLTSSLSNVRVLDLSPDRSKLLVSAIQGGSGENEFWTITVATGFPERVGNFTGRDAAWSADGQNMTFSKGSDLYLSGATGQQPSKLFTANGSAFALRFSSDGQRIRFTVRDAAQNTTSLWEIARDGSNPHALLPNWQLASMACCGSWTADGRYYIFQVTQKGLNTDTTITSLWALPEAARGGDAHAFVPVALTGGPMSFGSAWPARDAKSVWAIGVRPAGEAVKYDLAKKDFVPVAGGISATDLDFSSDGQWVAYVAIPEGTLWRCRPDGTDRLQLTLGPELAALPRWSPDGRHIAYISMRPGQQGKISMIAAGGGTAHEILPGSGSQIDVNWSPDASQILFGGFAHDSRGINIQILNLKTHKTMALPGSDGLFSPRWSPDGRYVAALSRDNTTVKLFDFKTQKWSDWLTTAAGTVNYPVWSADSKYLYFDDFVNDDEAIRRVKVGEPNAECVFVLGRIDRYVGAFGPWSGRTADGSWMFVRDHSTQEVYQLSVELP
jgi:Tol biopolymer transport system component